MRRGTIFIILFAVVAVGVVAASQFLRTQPPLEIRVAVSPLVEPWISSAVASFNATNPLVNSTRRVHYTVETIDDTQLWLDETRRWTAENHPAGWIPAASFSIQYANENRLSFVTSQPSLARTLLVWGAFADIVDDVESAGAVFDWDAVADAVSTRRMAFNHPTRSLSGMAVVFSGAAAFHEQMALTGASVNDSGFRAWIRPVLESVPNFNTLGGSVAQTWATRGASIGEIGLLPESDWMQNLRGMLVQTSSPITLRYPQYTVVFDFPLARWQDSATPSGSDEAAAIDALGRWLMGSAQQSATQNFGLRPASGDPTGGSFDSGEPYGALLSPVYEAVQPPSLNDIRRMADWVNSIVR